MNTSASIKELAAALVAVQAKAPAFPKTASGYGYKYTPIDDIINGLRPLLAANGLVVTQTVGEGTGDTIALTTTVMHAPSGEWLSETATIPAPAVGKANAAQQAGAAITYLRRYALSALFFLASEGDTDAEANAPTPERNTAPAPTLIQDKTRRQLHAMGAQLYGPDWDEKRAEMSAAFGVKSSSAWTEEDARRVIAGMQKRLDGQVKQANAELFPQ